MKRITIAYCREINFVVQSLDSGLVNLFRISGLEGFDGN